MATIASLIVDVAANTEQLNSGVTQINGQLDRVSGMATKVAGAFGIAFSAQAVIGFAKEILDLGGRLQDLSARTGIGVEALQELSEIAAESGSSIDALAASINQMQKRLAGNEDAAVEALKALGLSLQDLMQMTPEHQFYEIARAIAAIEDPAKQVELGWKLFGKSFGEIKATVLADVDAIRSGTATMSAETSKTLDDIGDSIGRLARNAKAYAADVVAAIWNIPATEGERAKRDAEDAERLLKQMHDMAGGTKSPFAAMLAGDGKPLATPDAGWINDFDRGIRVLVEDQQKAAAAAKKAADEHQRFVDSVSSLTSTAVGARRGFGMIGELLPELTGDTQGWREELETLSSTTLPDLETRLQHLGHEGIDQLDARVRGLKDSLQSLRQGDFKTVFSDLGSFFTSGHAFDQIGKGILQGFGHMIAGGITSLISTGLSLLGKGIGHLFGMDDPEKQVNPIREAFVQAAGGLDTLNRRAHDAGMTLDHLLDARTPEAYKRAIDELNAAFDFQDKAMQTLDETVKKYGFSIEELGPALQRQNLDKQAQQIYQDFKVLTGAGIAIDVVLGKMGNSVNDFVHDALRTGTEIPAALAPVLQRMVELGQLTDQNGNVITDLQAAGVKFSMTMSEGFEKLIGTVERLTDAIARGLGLAIANIPPINVPVSADNIDTIPMAAGGMGRTTGPTLFYSAGNEDFAFSGEGSRFGAGGGGGQEIHTHVYLDGREIAESVNRTNDRRFQSRRKVRAA